MDLFIFLHSLKSLDEADKLKTFESEKKPVDIGFPAMRLTRSEETKMKAEHRAKLKNNPQIEKLARNLQCKIINLRISSTQN